MKAMYHKGRAKIELTEYTGALEVLKEALAQEPENAEVKREIARAETALKKYQEKEQKMFQRMFAS